jgi:hypothetical protein
MTRTTVNQRLCGRRNCTNGFEALKAHFALGRYHTPSGGNLIQRTPDFIGPKQPLTPDRPWRVVAGPALGHAELRLVTVAEDAAARLNRGNRSIGAMRARPPRSSRAIAPRFAMTHAGGAAQNRGGRGVRLPDRLGNHLRQGYGIEARQLLAKPEAAQRCLPHRSDGQARARKGRREGLTISNPRKGDAPGRNRGRADFCNL